MTITLADVYMLTGVRIFGSVQPYEYLSAGSKRLAKIADYIGWASYILNHVGDGSIVSEREYVAFLNMWLERFIFCGSSCGPTYNHKLMAEHLTLGKDIPLGIPKLSSEIGQRCLRDGEIGFVGYPRKGVEIGSFMI